MTTVLYATDLIFTSRIGATARATGETLRGARGIESLRTALDAGDARQVIVDLDADESIAAIECAATAIPRVPILAYVSHVRADLAEAARHAGADTVMARSAFVQRLEAILSPPPSPKTVGGTVDGSGDGSGDGRVDGTVDG